MLQKWILEYSDPWAGQWHKHSRNMLYFRHFIGSNGILNVIRQVPDSYSGLSYTISVNQTDSLSKELHFKLGK